MNGPKDLSPGTGPAMPGLRVSLAASPVELENALSWLFQFLLNPTEPPDVHIDAIGMCNEDVESRMPSWLSANLPAAQEGEMPLLVYGPANKVGTVGRFDGLASCAFMELGSRRLQLLCGMGRDGNQTRSIIPSLLMPLLREILLLRGCLLLHAASVEVRPNIGILLVAPSGGGKTTTALSMVRLGCRLVSDDLVVLDLAGGQPWIWGIPKPLNLRKPTTHFFEELRPYRASETLQTERISLDPHSIYGPACIAAGCRLQAIYFLTLQDEATVACHLDIEKTILQLVRAHTFSRTQRMGCRSVLAILEATNQTPAYQLSTGSNPHLLGNWLLQHAEQHAAM